MLGIVGVDYIVELCLVPPDAGATLAGLIPGNVTSSTLPVIIGMVGAVVMPHDLFLHSGPILSRRTPTGDPRRLVRRSTVESVVALNLALLVNTAIVLMAAAAFHGTVEITSLAQAHETLIPILGQAAAGVFALALLAAGLSSSACTEPATSPGHHPLQPTLPDPAGVPLIRQPCPLPRSRTRAVGCGGQRPSLSPRPPMPPSLSPRPPSSSDGLMPSWPSRS